MLLHLLGNPKRKAGFSGAAGAGERQQPHLGLQQQILNGIYLRPSPNEGGGLGWQFHRVSEYRRCGGRSVGLPSGRSL
jgi:hypothetical protein